MLLQKMFKGYKVQKYEPFSFGKEELATITLVVPRSELVNVDEIKKPIESEAHLNEVHEQSSEEESEIEPEASLDELKHLIARNGAETIDLGVYKTPESETLIAEHGFSISGIESVLHGKQKTHKKYEFELI